MVARHGDFRSRRLHIPRCSKNALRERPSCYNAESTVYGRKAERQIEEANLYGILMAAWRCPVCSALVRHDPREDEATRLGARHRCPVCKLNVVFDGPSNQMMVAPFDAAEEQTSRHKKNL